MAELLDHLKVSIECNFCPRAWHNAAQVDNESTIYQLTWDGWRVAMVQGDDNESIQCVACPKCAENIKSDEAEIAK